MTEGTDRIEREFAIVNRLGLHARAAAKLVKLANRFASEIRITKNGVEVNGKSIMGVLMLAAHRDTSVVVRAEGPDAAEAIREIGGLITRKFDEEE